MESSVAEYSVTLSHHYHPPDTNIQARTPTLENWNHGAHWNLVSFQASVWINHGSLSLIQRVSLCGQLDQKKYIYSKCPLKWRISIHKKSYKCGLMRPRLVCRVLFTNKLWAGTCIISRRVGQNGRCMWD